MTQSSDRQNQGISRTICIGLGGTGNSVLMRIRRLIVDKYGDLKNLPIVSFVHIDTDKNATRTSSLRTGSTYHGIDISFTSAEKVVATMTAAQVNNFVQELTRNSEYDRQNPYAHIDWWFPRQLLKDIKAIEEGAKGIRPIGRLAFFHNYEQIKTSIESAERRTRGHEAQLLRNGIKVEPGLNIFVVGSLCGGTGSGMFLDIAYSLRHDYGNDNAQIFGYLVISPKLYGNTANMNANTYSALKELDYYTKPGTQFNAVYDRYNQVIVRENRPPFDYTYLISDQTLGEYQILEQRKLCNVIAHKIALEFAGELAPSVKGMRDNFTLYMSQWDEHPRPNVQRYLTFGLAAIYFPRDTIVQIALNRISVKLVNFWLNGEQQNQDLNSLLETFLMNWHSDLVKKEGFNLKISEATQEGNKTFANSLNNWRRNLETRINECKNAEDRQNLRRNLSRNFREEFRKVQSNEIEENRGIWLRRLQQTSPNIANQLKQNINDFLENLLNPSNPNFGIKTVQEWLEGMQTELNDHQRTLNEEILGFGTAKKPEDLDKKIQNIEQRLDDIEKKPQIPIIGNNAKNREFQIEAKTGVKEIADLLKYNFELHLQKEAKKVVEELLRSIQYLITKVAEFSRQVENLQRIYQEQEKKLKEMNFDEMIGQAIFDDQDIENCYNILFYGQSMRSQLALVSINITNAAIRSESLINFIDRNRIKDEQLKQQIEINIDKDFGTIIRTIPVSVIKRFIQNYPGINTAERLQQILEESQPLLRLNLTNPYYSESPAKRSKLVGFRDSDEPEETDFKQALIDSLSILPAQIKQTQADQEILFINEYAGFPLRLIKDLEKMKSHYISQTNMEGMFLHNDRQINFIDIIPDAQTIEDLQHLFYPCLAFGLLPQDPETKEFVLRYHDNLSNSYYQTKLSSNWDQALEELAQRADLVASLKQMLDQAIASIQANPNLWETNYLPLLRKFVEQVKNLAENSPNYPYKQTVIGTKGNNNGRQKEGIINWFSGQIEGKIKLKGTTNNQPGVNNENSATNANTPYTAENILEAEILETSTNTVDNRAKRREEIQLLQQDLNNDIITEEEYEIEKQKILEKYPIN
jgi:Tubulin like